MYEREGHEERKRINHYGFIQIHRTAIHPIFRDFVMMDVVGVSYDEKLDAILTTLNLQMSVKALERYISRNTNPVGKFNKLIKILGLRNAYRVYQILR